MYPNVFDGLTLAGLYVHEPGGALTNILLAILGFYLIYRMSRKITPFGKYWRYFILMLALASTGGILTHGFPQLLGPNWFFVIWSAKNAFVPIGNYLATLAFIFALFPERAEKLRWLFAAKALLIIVSAMVLYSFTPIAIDLGATYIMIFALSQKHIHTMPGARHFRNAFAVAILSGISYIMKFDIDYHWLTHKDIVHVFVYLSMWFIFLGVNEYESARNENQVRAVI
jgi:hypothetical protein